MKLGRDARVPLRHSLSRRGSHLIHPADAELLVDLLDRQFKHVTDNEKERTLLLLPALVDFLVSSPNISGILSDFRDEAAVLLRDLTVDDVKLRAQLLELWKGHETILRDLLKDDLENDQLHAYCRLDRYEGSLGDAPQIQLPVSGETA